MESERTEKIRSIVRSRRGGAAHDLSHVLRVLNYAHLLSQGKKVNAELLEAMCLLHDLVRVEGEQEGISVSESAREAEKILAECGYLPDELDKILRGIRSHSLVSIGGVSGRFPEPETVEEKILFDADKLDALGPSGIIRWFISTSQKGMGLADAANLYLKIAGDFEKKKGGLYTPKGNEIGRERLQ